MVVRRRRRLAHAEPPSTPQLLAGIRSLSRPLRSPADLDPLLDRIADARYVLLGEASHGTHEYYTWRAALSRRLIEEKGFSFIAVEGDWPDCYRVNRYVKDYLDSGDNAREVLHNFERWPTWMWANEEVVDLAEWLRRHNERRPTGQQAGFYGLDVYSLWDSLYQVLGYLGKHAPSALTVARRAFQCFEPYGEDVQEYARATRWVDESCEDEVIALLTELRRSARAYPQDGHVEHFNAEQNALAVKNAEHYYRTMVQGGPESWNVRDRHMVETLANGPPLSDPCNDARTPWSPAGSTDRRETSQTLLTANAHDQPVLLARVAPLVAGTVPALVPRRHAQCSRGRDPPCLAAVAPCLPATVVGCESGLDPRLAVPGLALANAVGQVCGSP